MIEVRAEVRPPGPYRLPRPSADGLVRRRAGVLFRFLRVDGHDVLLRAAQLRDGRVVLGARACPVPATRGAMTWPPPAPDDASSLADHAPGPEGCGLAADGPPRAAGPAPHDGGRAASELARAAAITALGAWRFALGVDVDLRPFVAAHKDDPLIGPSVRTRPWMRPARRPSVFEALLCAVCEQLIAFEDAVRIERRLIARHGVQRAPDVASHPRLRDAPDAAAIAFGTVPAQLEACGLSPKRAVALHRAAREIATGRIDAGPDCDPDRVLLRLGRLPEIGTWTLALVASQALGRDDRPPSGDLNLRKALGRILTGDPRARVPEHEVDAWLDRYAPWGALAAAHIMATRGDLLPGRGAATVPTTSAPPPVRHPSLAGSPTVARTAPAVAVTPMASVAAPALAEAPPAVEPGRPASPATEPVLAA